MTICRLCNGATAVGLRVLISPHNNQEYTLYQCKNCGSRFFDPSQHEVLLNQLYENISLRNPDKSTIEFLKFFPLNKKAFTNNESKTTLSIDEEI